MLRSALDRLDVRRVKGDHASFRSYARRSVGVDTIEHPFAVLPANLLSHQCQARPQGIYHDRCTVFNEALHPSFHVREEGG